MNGASPCLFQVSGNRLTQATTTGLPTQSFQYDIESNITSKSDVGTYT